MTVVAMPDVAGAVIAHLLASPEIVALAGARISSARAQGWGLPSYAVLVEPGRGGFPTERPFEDERFDIRCYGPDARTANLLWRTVNAYLIRHDGGATVFVAAATSVCSVVKEGGPLRLVDGDGLWPCTLGSYHVAYCALPVGG